MARLEGKVAIITGAGQGMGRTGAMLFAKEGAKVVVAEFVTQSGEETVKMIKEAGGEAVFVKADVSNEEDVKKMIKTTVATYGKLDVLYNNAAIIGEVKPTDESTLDNWNKVITVNLTGVFLCMKYAIPEMLKGGGGSIINTSSQAGERGFPNVPPYSASKGGVQALTRAAAMEYAKKNIRVNCINPGVIATPMSMTLSEETVKRFSEAIPQGRFGETEEVAYAALFLASNESSHTTGHALWVDGGMEADSGVFA